MNTAQKKAEKELQTGFESVAVENNDKTVVKSGRNINTGLVNGVWTDQDTKGRSRPTWHKRTQNA